jgi:hypothetical protein
MEVGESSKAMNNSNIVDDQKTQDKGNKQEIQENILGHCLSNSQMLKGTHISMVFFFQCNKFGHKAIKSRSRMNQYARSFYGQFFACNKVGHKVSECKNRIDGLI